MMSVSEKHLSSGESIRANILFGSTVSILLVGIGAWAATTSLASAVIASGTVVVESSAKKVQHQSGGIVGAIFVHEGDRVSEGDVVVQLDDTMTRADLHVIEQQYDRTVARQARLQAELLGLPEIKFPDSLAKRRDPDVDALIAGEKALFESRIKASTGLKSQLETRVEQLEQQIKGLAAQRKGTDKAATLVERDYLRLQTLYEKKRLVLAEQVSEPQRELAHLQGESGRLAAAIAETEGKINEMGLQALQVDEEMRKEVNEELRELNGKEVELVGRRIVAENQLRRTEIRAPRSGFVQELAVHTVGGVIAPGETIMRIVPEQDSLDVDVMVAPADIADVVPKRQVWIRFTSFDARTTPECKGTVQWVSGEPIKDEQRQMPYFLARVTLDDPKACLRDARRLQPGMPAEAYIQTGERTVWSYVMKPFFDQIQRAFKE